MYIGFVPRRSRALTNNEMSCESWTLRAWNSLELIHWRLQLWQDIGDTPCCIGGIDPR